MWVKKVIILINDGAPFSGLCLKKTISGECPFIKEIHPRVDKPMLY
jgi:hypothetical protein